MLPFICSSAVKMREQGGQLFKQAHQEFKEVGFLTDVSLQAVVTTEDQLAAEIDKELLTLNELTAAEIIDKLENLLAKTQLLKNNAARTKRLVTNISDSSCIFMRIACRLSEFYKMG